MGVETSSFSTWMEKKKETLTLTVKKITIYALEKWWMR
jgi:hypothetical protein